MQADAGTLDVGDGSQTEPELFQLLCRDERISKLDAQRAAPAGGAA